MKTGFKAATPAAPLAQAPDFPSDSYVSSSTHKNDSFRLAKSVTMGKKKIRRA